MQPSEEDYHHLTLMLDWQKSKEKTTLQNTTAEQFITSMANSHWKGLILKITLHPMAVHYLLTIPVP